MIYHVLWIIRMNVWLADLDIYHMEKIKDFNSFLNERYIPDNPGKMIVLLDLREAEKVL